MGRHAARSFEAARVSSRILDTEADGRDSMPRPVVRSPSVEPASSCRCVPTYICRARTRREQTPHGRARGANAACGVGARCWRAVLAHGVGARCWRAVLALGVSARIGAALARQCFGAAGARLRGVGVGAGAGVGARACDLRNAVADLLERGGERGEARREVAFPPLDHLLPVPRQPAHTRTRTRRCLVQPWAHAGRVAVQPGGARGRPPSTCSTRGEWRAAVGAVAVGAVA
eukprot:1551921-Prymnesium_polylepis.1